jgi:hypothetical protein
VLLRGLGLLFLLLLGDATGVRALLSGLDGSSSGFGLLVLLDESLKGDFFLIIILILIVVGKEVIDVVTVVLIILIIIIFRFRSNWGGSFLLLNLLHGLSCNHRLGLGNWLSNLRSSSNWLSSGCLGSNWLCLGGRGKNCFILIRVFLVFVEILIIVVIRIFIIIFVGSRCFSGSGGKSLSILLCVGLGLLEALVELLG